MNPKGHIFYPGGGGGKGVRTPPPGKSQLAIGFLRTVGTNSSREAI